ncbi:MAG: uroporphyrinogen decarboxylase family protein [Clostridiales bacterium]|jgi:uroporphyrinogen decarboxylase|nr:uroporphyrinogen-III decarboxylase [Eubacteriales bacterium]MDH7566290.1 uroporphyrinogen decarboxylase family protein [Clostridiales bacterium]MDH7566293.1 uroporphyrinogen decarboxylase family protein [Clostridiales bacterium]
MSEKTGQELYNEHLERLKKAIRMEKTDRPPVSLNAEAFTIQYAGGKVSDFFKDPEYGNDLFLKGIKMLGDIDCVGPSTPETLGAFFMSKMKLPGRDLPDNAIWQIVELNPMTVEDYDVIIEKGFMYYTQEATKKYIPETEEIMARLMPLMPKLAQKFIDAGYVNMIGMCGGGGGYESLIAYRGISNFMKDLHKIPDKVMAAIEAMHAEGIQNMRKALSGDNKPLCIFSGGARAAGDFISMKTFDKLVWPYLKEGIEVAAEYDVNAYLHLDNCWDRFIDHFLDLPKGRCIFSPDGTTDIFKAHEVLGGHMCFQGDVPAALFTLGTPDQVYAYSRRLIDEFSDQGFIMGSGCSVPSNAKKENVEAWMAATFGR